MGQSNTHKSRVFISYKRNAEPDDSVAFCISNKLKEQCDVFIDKDIPVGMNWAERIEAELHKTDFLVPLLSDKSVQSEMVLGEIETAARLAKERSGHPIILPVRLAYREPFKYPLSAHLNHINWAFWENNEDNPRIINELMLAISGGSFTIDQKSQEDIIQAVETPDLEMPYGTMDPQSRFYIERSSDRIALDAIKQQGQTIVIKGPRQVGKSSLLRRIIDAADKAEKHHVFLDFQLFDENALKDGDVFFRQFCAWFTYELGMDDKTEDYWKNPLGSVQRCSRYFSHYILREFDRPLVLAMDETDRIFDTPFCTEFFSMLRSWHNSRATNPLWKRLDLALVTSSEQYQFIRNLNQSPFNVGEVVELSDFTSEQVAELNRRHNSPLTPDRLKSLMDLVNGHPYLVRKALYMVAGGQTTAADLFAQATDDQGPFDDHLCYLLFRLFGKDQMIQCLNQIIRNNICPNEQIFFPLSSVGLVRRVGKNVVPRCKLYADYFREHLHV